MVSRSNQAVRGRQAEPEAAAMRTPRLKAHRTAMPLHNGTCPRQTQSGALRLGGEEGAEDLRAMRIRNAAAIVEHRGFNTIAITAHSDGHVRGDAVTGHRGIDRVLRERE